MPQTVEIRFKGNRRGFHDWPDAETPLRLNEPVLVEVERGLDFGWVNATDDAALAKCGGCTSCGPEEPAGAPAGTEPPAEAATRTPVVRRAAADDIAQHEALRRSEEEVRREVAARATHHNLAMRISDVEWQWDRQRLSVYFTAERRVDFRALVRELAGHFRTRLELRQIGVREEAARLGGIGRCGREFCCSTWLTEPSPVNLSLAKDQRLSLNPAQISGGCGRLLCCLKYEHDFYLAARKRFPKEGKVLQTLLGQERVVAVDLFRERVSLRSEANGPRTIGVLELRDEIDQALQAAPPGAVPAPEPTTPSAPRRPPGAPRRGRGGRGSPPPGGPT
jgi:cell fate regulator YaaT (PSP1 superfamily)